LSERSIPVARTNPEALSDTVVDTETWDDGTVVEWLAFPLPYERRPLVYSDDAVRKGYVDPRNLIATQRRVTREGVQRADIHAPIRVAELGDGRMYVLDGHHRVYAALKAEALRMPANIVEVREGRPLRKNPSFATRSDFAEDMFDDIAKMLDESYVGFDDDEIFVFRRWDQTARRFEVAEEDLETFIVAVRELANDYDNAVHDKYLDADYRKDCKIMSATLYAVAQKARKKTRR
jgi:hypothetical protein